MVEFNFNISYSAMGNYKACQRGFYYGYVAKVKPGKQFPCWGNAGNAVHTTLEYANSKTVEEMKKIFTDLWDNYDLSGTNKTPFYKNLNFDEYWQAVLNGLARKYDIVKFEEKFEYKDNPTIKGFIDVIATTKGVEFTELEKKYFENNPDLFDKNIVVDWKTNSKKDDGQIEQLKFYAYLYYRKYKKLPRKFILEYVKIGERTERVMTMSDVNDVKETLINFFREISTKKVFSDWSYNKKSCFFCAHKDRCKNDMVDKESETFEIEIKNCKFQIMNPTTTMFDTVALKHFSYEIENKDIVVANYKRKWGKDWDGRISLKKRHKYGIGLLDRMIKLINQYADYTKKHILINIKDDRNTITTVTPIDKPLVGLTPYWYQNEAVDVSLRTKVGIIKVPTSGGKTVIAAEIYRKMPEKTLFIVDRNILLKQTVDEFERVLDMKDQVGTIIGGVSNIKSNLTVASVQTIAVALKSFKKANKNVQLSLKAWKTNPANEEFKNNLDDAKAKRKLAKEKTLKMMTFLEDVETIIIDECHVAKSESYNLLCENIPNAHYRIGLSGTPGDGDFNFLELEKNVGKVMYEIKAQELIQEGTIMMPTIKFIKYKFGFEMGGDYNDRMEQLFEHEDRNKIITQLCKNHSGEVILILVHRLSHGNDLVEHLKDEGHDAFFIQGSVNAKLREEILEDSRNGHPRILIGTSSIVSKGLNLKPLRVVINATGNAGDKQTIQTLGRVLRMYEGKDEALYYDFVDDIKSFLEHSKQRIKAFENEGYKVEIIEAFNK